MPVMPSHVKQPVATLTKRPCTVKTFEGFDFQVYVSDVAAEAGVGLKTIWTNIATHSPLCTRL